MKKRKTTFAQAFQGAREQRERAERAGKKPVGSGFAVQLIGFMCCLVMPAFWTAIAPVAFTTLTREDGKVRAEANQNLLFLIPYRKVHVEDVQSVDDRFRQGEMVTRRSNGERHRHRAESESFLVLKGKGDPVEIPMSPVNAKSTVAKVEAFLKDPSQSRLRVFTVANWKFSVIGGAFVTMLALLYVTGVILSMFRFFWRLMKPKRVAVTSPLLRTPEPTGVPQNSVF